MKKLLLLCFTLLTGQMVFGQTFSATYNFTNVVMNGGGMVDPSPVPTATGVTFTSFTAKGAVSANPNASGRFSFTGHSLGATNNLDVFTGAIDLTKYYEITINPAAGYTFDLTQITFILQRSGTGIRQYAVRSSADGFASNLPASITPANANLQVVSGNIFQVSDPSTTALSGSKITLTGFTGLSAAITFRFYGFNAEATGGTFSLDDVLISGKAITAAPTNAAGFPKTSNITATSADITSNISEAGKTYYVVIPSTGNAPTASQVKAGKDGSDVAALKSGSFTNLANTDATATLSGLTPDTDYKIYVVAEDADAIPNLQALVSGLSVSTLPLVDVTPPVNASTFPKISNIGTTTFDLIHNIDEAGTTFYVLIPANGIAPVSAAQVKAGQDGSGAPAFKSGSFTNLPNTDASTGVSGLSPSTAYNVYIVSQDNVTVPNVQSSVATLNLVTSGPPSIIISQYYEGGGVNKWIELTNLSNNPVNTASPQLKLALYGVSGDAGNINITGAPTQLFSLNITIPARGTVLIGNTGNSTEVPYLTSASAATTSNSVINFNGNDGVALLDANNNILDAFGQGVNAKDVSYVRNIDVTSPSATFTLTDWTVVDIQTVQNAIDDDDINQLGVHFPPVLTPCVAPSIAATVLVFSNITTNSITATFTKSTDANEYLVVRSLNNTLSESPVDGTVYNVGTPFGGGIVVSRLATNTFTDNSVASATNYTYFVIALNNISCTGGPKYLSTTILSGSQTTKTLFPCVAPASQPTAFTITSSNYNFVQASFTPVTDADEYLVVMSKNNTLTANPVNQKVYAVGDELAGGIIVKRGAGNTFTRNDLTQNTNYYFFVFALNSSCTNGPVYLTNTPLLYNFKTQILDVNKLNFYYGNLHSHSSYSDGNKDDHSKKPEDDYAFAKTAMNLDFLGISEHNHTGAGMSLANWQPGIDAAKRATTSTFIAMHGMEWGVISGGGHVIVYGIDSLIGWETGENQIYVPKNTYAGTTGLFRIINRHGLNAIATLAHPNTTDYNNISASYDMSADSAIVGTALESGPAFSTNVTYSDPANSMSYLSYYNRMLAKGYHLGATIDHDNHNLTFGKHTRARLVVMAPALTENDLLDAIKKMRFYASEDSAAKVTFTINKQPVGSVFKVAGAPQIELSSKTTSTVSSVKILYGEPGSDVTPVTLTTGTSASLTYTDNALANLKTGYYYADIVEADGSRIITSPIWYTRDDAVVKKDQTITFTPTKTVVIGSPDFDAGAKSSNTSINIVYTSSDPSIATVSNSDIHILKAGTVSITATQPGDAFYNAGTATQVLTIAPIPTATISGTAAACVNATAPIVTFTGTVGTAPFTFTYTQNGSANRTVTSSTKTATVAAPTNTSGTFTYTLVSVADAYANQLQSGSATITVNPLPVVSITSNKGLSISKGDALILTAAGGTQYNWTGSEIISGQNSASLTIRPKQSGTYKVVVSNANGCSTDQSISIVVINDYKLEASTVVTPNGDGINDKFIIKNIDYYPNNVLRIFDKSGRILYTKQGYANDWDGMINGGPLSEGTYYYILDMGAGFGNFKGFINILRD